MRSPLVLLAACLLLSSNSASAQPANHYGDAGRTVVIPSLGGTVYGSG